MAAYMFIIERVFRLIYMTLGSKKQYGNKLSAGNSYFAGVCYEVNYPLNFNPLKVK